MEERARKILFQDPKGLFPARGGTWPRRALMAGWVCLALLSGAGALVFGPHLSWIFAGFWAASLVLAWVSFRLMGQTQRSAQALARLAGLSREILWAVDKDLRPTRILGTLGPIPGQTPEEMTAGSLTDLLCPKTAQELDTRIRKGEPFTMEGEVLLGADRTLAVEIWGGPEPGEGAFQGGIREISRIRSQDRQIQELSQELERAQHLKNLGLLAGSVAHDLNNILSGIATYPEVLLMDRSLDTKIRQGLQMIKDSGRKASSVVSDLLTISRGARADRQVLNLNRVIERYLTAADFQKIKETYAQVEIEVDLEPELLNISGSYIHVEKAVMNLMLNAVEETAGLPDATVRLSTANLSVEEAGTLAPGEYVVLRVEDNGSGVPEALQEKIFDPFFTQKEMGRSGTGLGLTVVKTMVADHQGKIRVASKGRGTVFELFFPAIREALPTVQDEEAMADIMGQGEVILVVDDLPSQRKIAATILTNLGYEVFCAANGLEALAVVQERQVDLLVLDMIMAPSISGLETYRRIKAVRPDQKAIIASGHSESEDVIKTQELGAGSFVKKPYTILDMGIAVKEELERD